MDRRALRASTAAGTRVRRLATAEARTAGIPAPRVLVAPGDEPNASSFALRARWLVTTQEAKTLDELALEGMVAHEIVHLRDGDATVASLYLVLAGSPAARDPRRRSSRCLSIARCGRSRSCCGGSTSWPVPPNGEHRADVAAAMLTRYPPGIVAGAAASRAVARAVCGPSTRSGSSRATRPATRLEHRAALVAEM